MFEKILRGPLPGRVPAVGAHNCSDCVNGLQFLTQGRPLLLCALATTGMLRVLSPLGHSEAANGYRAPAARRHWAPSAS